MSRSNVSYNEKAVADAILKAQTIKKQGGVGPRGQLSKCGNDNISRTSMMSQEIIRSLTR